MADKRLKRIKSGIPGLDDMFYGGIIKGTTTLVAGHSGTGKTLFGLQFIKQGLKMKEKCMYISLQENPEEILKYYDILTMDWKKYVKNKNLVLMTSKMSDIGQLIPKLEEIFSKVQINRIFIDEVSCVFEGTQVVQEIDEMFYMIKQKVSTTIFTAAISKEGEYFGLVGSPLPKIADSILALQQARKGGNIVKLISVLKAKGTFCDTRVHKLNINNKGLEVKSIFEDENSVKLNAPISSEVSYHIWFMDGIYGERYMKETMKAFEQIHPEITVYRTKEMDSFNMDKIIEYPVEKMRRFIKPQSIPLGIIALPFEGVYKLASEGLLANLGDYIDTNIYYEEAVKACIYNNAIYGVPVDVYSRCLVYRKDFLEKYNLEVPETMDDLLKAADYILSKENNPTLCGLSFWWYNIKELTDIFLEFAWGNETDIYDTNGNININNSKMIESIKFMKHIINKYKINPENTQNISSNSMNKFLNGETVFLIFTPDVMQILRWQVTSPVRNKVGIAPLPRMAKGEKRYSVLYGSALCIPKNTKDLKSAGSFLKYYTNLENHKKRELDSAWPFASVKQLWKDKEVLSVRPYCLQTEKILKTSFNPYQDVKYYNSVAILISEKIFKVLNNKADIENTFKLLNKDLKRLINRKSIYSKVVEEIVNYLEKNYYKQITLNDISKRAGLSQRYMEKIFKMEIGMPIFNYLIEIRIEKAKKMLKQENININETAKKSGYNDVPWFCKTFKSFTGYTPSEYRYK